RPSFMHPELGKPGTLERGLLPVYSETEGITTKSLRQWVATALDMVAGRVTDPFPPELRLKYALIPYERALRVLHRPANPHVSPLDPLYPPRRRLVFEEFFTMSLGLLIRRRGTHKEKGLPHAEFENVVRAVEAGLPFPLTGAQRRAI